MEDVGKQEMKVDIASSNKEPVESSDDSSNDSDGDDATLSSLGVPSEWSRHHPHHLRRKRSKQAESSESGKKTAVPSPHFLSHILKHVSQKHVAIYSKAGRPPVTFLLSNRLFAGQIWPQSGKKTISALKRSMGRNKKVAKA